MYKSFFLFLLLFCPGILFAQAIPSEYQQAKDQLEAGNYYAAIDGFEDFLNEKRYGKLALYAAYHLGDAALRSGQGDRAIRQFKVLAERRWEYQEESKVRLTEAYFYQNRILEGLRQLNNISNETNFSQVSNMAYDFLRKESTGFFVKNLGEFKELDVYTAAMSQVFQEKMILSEQEKALYYELKGQNQLNPSGTYDQTLNLTMMLPFSDSGKRISKSSFLFDFYQGVALAKEHLEAEGRSLSFRFFDTKRDLGIIRGLLEDESILYSDAIIGPIYPDETRLVSEFAERARIPFIHPLSNLSDQYAGSHYSFLFRPSVEDLVEGIYQALQQQAWGSRVAIGYGGSSRDQDVAEKLKDKLERRGYNLVDYREISPRNSSTILRDLKARVVNEQSQATVDQLILLTDDPSIASPILSYVESLTTNLPILVMDSWLSFNFSNFEMLPFDNFYFISNNGLNWTSDEMNAFRKNFFKRYEVFPKSYSMLGYELVYWLSAHAGVGGTRDLRESLNDTGFQPGKLTWGYDFRYANSNRYVPVFHLKNGELNRIDLP